MLYLFQMQISEDTSRGLNFSGLQAVVSEKEKNCESLKFELKSAENQLEKLASEKKSAEV